MFKTIKEHDAKYVLMANNLKNCLIYKHHVY